MLTTNPFDSPDFDGDKLREECGVFGVSSTDSAAALVALGLHALQHRGQEAAGITSFDGEHFHTHRAMGHVAGNFDRDDVIRALPGTVACGHVRYSTSGETALRNVVAQTYVYGDGNAQNAGEGSTQARMHADAPPMRVDAFEESVVSADDHLVELKPALVIFALQR